MIRIGTRGSELALWQANHIAERLGRDRTAIVIIKTRGDKIQNLSFEKMEGKGFFTKEIEDALLTGEVDLAVHSMKDLPTDETPGLRVAAVTRREDPSDVLLVRGDSCREGPFLSLDEGAVVGTSSLRRTAQLRHAAGHLAVRPLRGNVTTRVRRLREKNFDAIILARAGIARLAIDLTGIRQLTLPFSWFLPAPAQGALALQIRDDDAGLYRAVRELHHEESASAVAAERAFLKFFGGGCHVPLGALAYRFAGEIHLSGVVASPDGKTLLRDAVVSDDAARAGEALARLLKEKGADALI
ncbi:MAG TPA: hydroxymethylbilane synthase [Spirochaetes bacterium]|nr:hydroxymethylbilane synthase [Spirochaetota bacterium]